MVNYGALMVSYPSIVCLKHYLLPVLLSGTLVKLWLETHLTEMLTEIDQTHKTRLQNCVMKSYAKIPMLCHSYLYCTIHNYMLHAPGYKIGIIFLFLYWFSWLFI